MLTLDIAGAQIDGARDYQEDAFLITHLGDASDRNGTSSLCIVADGMGGHAAGNVASNIAVQTFNKHVTGSYPHDDLAAVMREAVLQANNAIADTVRETAALKGMGCTLVGAVIDNRQIRWVSVGDSHFYLLRDGDLVKHNADHSYGGFLDRMAEEGTPIEPEAGFSRNMLMSALTGEDIADIDCPESGLDLQPGDRLIIASDGLDSLSSGQIIACCETAENAKACVDALLQGVDEADMPRQDNTTVIVVDVGAQREPEIVAAPAPATTAAPAAEPAAVPATPAPAPAMVVEDVPEHHEARGKTGLIIAAVLAHVVVIGAAVWWFLRPEPLPGPDRATPELPAPAVVTAPPAPEPEPEPDPITVTEPAPDAPPDLGTEPTATPPAAESEIGSIAAHLSPEPFRDALRGGGTGPLMIAVPGGRYLMGSPSSSPIAEQRPQHSVTVAPFVMSVYEVTVGDYARFAAATGRRAPPVGPGAERGSFPATYVSWDDAAAYAQWLSEQTGQRYRLPSEAEWEYAARAGTVGNYWWGHDLGVGNAHCIACMSGLDPRNPTSIGRFDPNPFGLYDTAGNVQEWVQDCWHRSYEGAPADGSVFAGGDCELRVVRGGSFTGGANSLRSAHRDKFKPDTRNDSIGFRLARDP